MVSWAGLWRLLLVFDCCAFRMLVVVFGLRVAGSFVFSWVGCFSVLTMFVSLVL